MSESSRLNQIFACPVHKTILDAKWFCVDCGKPFLVAKGTPILLNEKKSVFRVDDYLSSDGYDGASGYAGSLDHRKGIRQVYRRLVAHLGRLNPPCRSFSPRRAVAEIKSSIPDARILVVGAGDTELPGDVIYTDVAFGARVQCIADAHDLPFLDGVFDACIVVAVLEHVVDPYRCVQEIQRVLTSGGFVYAETPFMQPVHMGAHDFTRFTFLGHRRLFRWFEQISAGVVGGPGISVAQLARYAIASMSDQPVPRKWLKLLALFLTYPLRWLDHLSDQKLSSYDSASGFYFFGRLSSSPLGDRELLGLHRGL